MAATTSTHQIKTVGWGMAGELGRYRAPVLECGVEGQRMIVYTVHEITGDGSRGWPVAQLTVAGGRDKDLVAALEGALAAVREGRLTH